MIEHDPSEEGLALLASTRAHYNFGHSVEDEEQGQGKHNLPNVGTARSLIILVTMAKKEK